MMDNLYYYNQGREVPETAKKPIQGGRMNGKTDINPMWRIKKLTELFGPCGIGWYYKSVREWTEPYEESIAAFVKIELYVKADGEWSMPIQGTGGSMFVEMQKSGPHVSDECYKMATTDAISVACKQLGIGADVYWDKDTSKYGKKEGNGKPEQNPKNEGNGKPEQNPKNEGSGKQEKNQKEDEERNALMMELDRELTRTGYGWGAVIKRYKVGSTNDLTRLQLKDCIGRMKLVPDEKVS